MRATCGLGWGAVAAAMAAVLSLAGCGTPGAPQAPSLNLPDRVADLAATRAGNQVALAWTMPRKNTDRLLLKGDITVHICHQLVSGPCETAGDLQLPPGARGTFTEMLPATLAAGAPRPLRYFVELKNSAGRSAGPSNTAMVLAGEAPAPISGLTAEVSKGGIVLRWTPLDATEKDEGSTAIRLHRKLLTPAPAKTERGLLAAPPEPVEQSLFVEPSAQSGRTLDRALDQTIRLGESYEYLVQRVARVSVDGQSVELAGPLSAPLRVEAADVFPPEVPTALAAVANAGESGSDASVDLSWQPVADSDLAGYAVYRREAESPWQRISSAEPVVPPAFHDVHVLAGHTYRYAVSAFDQSGHESARSAEAEETIPSP